LATEVAPEGQRRHNEITRGWWPFALREPNNLTPRTPQISLAVMYEMARAWRRYDA
jgi:hypothetical protein